MAKKKEQPRELAPPSESVPAQEPEDQPDVIDFLGEAVVQLAKIAGAMNPDKTPIRVLSPKGHVLLITNIELNMEVPAICLRTRRP